MANEKMDKKSPNVPNLRFPGFEGEWKEKKLGCVSEFVKDRISTSSLSLNNYISTENLKQDFQGVSVASSIPSDVNVTSYKANDILFSNIRPYLKKIWKANMDGGCSSDVFVFRNKGECLPEFLYYSITNDNFINFVMIGAKGVKMPRGDKQQMEQYPIYLPTKPEQRKIAHFLFLIDQRISTQSQIIKELETLINGLIQTLVFGNRIGWRKIYLRNVLEERHEQNDKSYPIYSVAVRKGVVNQIEHLGRSFAAKNTTNYNVVRYGDIVYTKSPTGSFPYGIIKQSFVKHPVAVSPLYGVYMPENVCLGTILHYYFNSPVNANNYLHSLVQKGAKNTISITNQRFLDKELFLPTNKKEIERINFLLSSIQEKIDKESSTKDLLVKQKKYLLANMLI